MRLRWNIGLGFLGICTGIMATIPAGAPRERSSKQASNAQSLPSKQGGATPVVQAQIPTVNPQGVPGKPPETSPEPEKSNVEYKPNEMGMVPIVEYHDIRDKENKRSLIRSISNFKHDLERLYKENFRPVSLSEYLDGKIDLPAGKSPVVLTFDDARKSQFCYLKDGSLDPKCAIAILKGFHEKHPDFALKGMFFILPRRSFDQRETAERKLHELVQMGFEIGNHTVTHPHLNRLSDAKVQWEIATCSAMLKKLVPEAKVDTLAFPGGNVPKNKKIILEGASGGNAYTLRAAFLAAGSPAPPPFAKSLNMIKIVRIVAVEGEGGVTDWLDEFKEGLVKKYVSDGNPATLTIPKNYEKYVDLSRLKDEKLLVYEDKPVKKIALQTPSANDPKSNVKEDQNGSTAKKETVKKFLSAH